MHDTLKGIIRFEIITSELSSKFNKYDCLSTFYNLKMNDSVRAYYTLTEISDSVRIAYNGSDDENKDVKLFGPLKSLRVNYNPRDSVIHIFINNNSSWYEFKRNQGMVHYIYEVHRMTGYNIRTTVLRNYILK